MDFGESGYAWILREGNITWRLRHYVLEQTSHENNLEDLVFRYFIHGSDPTKELLFKESQVPVTELPWARICNYFLFGE